MFSLELEYEDFTTFTCVGKTIQYEAHKPKFQYMYECSCFYEGQRSTSGVVP